MSILPRIARPITMDEGDTPFKRGDYVVDRLGKVGRVVESNEDKTVVQWNRGDEARVPTYQLKRWAARP